MKALNLRKTLTVLFVGVAGLAGLPAQADEVSWSIRFGSGHPFLAMHGHDGYRQPDRRDFRDEKRDRDGRADHWGDKRDDGRGRGPDREDSVDARQQRQHERILQGMRSGALTPHEVHQLMRDQMEIRHMERRFLADGRIDRDEWQRLDKALDEASRNIREEKHDRQVFWR
jgi:hypothetical protein